MILGIGVLTVCPSVTVKMGPVILSRGSVLVAGDLQDLNVTFRVLGDFMVLTASRHALHVIQVSWFALDL